MSSDSDMDARDKEWIESIEKIVECLKNDMIPYEKEFDTITESTNENHVKEELCNQLILRMDALELEPNSSDRMKRKKLYVSDRTIVVNSQMLFIDCCDRPEYSISSQHFPNS